MFHANEIVFLNLVLLILLNHEAQVLDLPLNWLVNGPRLNDLRSFSYIFLLVLRLLLQSFLVAIIFSDQILVEWLVWMNIVALCQIIKVEVPLRSLNEYLRGFRHTLWKHLGSLVELVGQMAIGAATRTRRDLLLLLLSVKIWRVYRGRLTPRLPVVVLVLVRIGLVLVVKQLLVLLRLDQDITVPADHGLSLELGSQGLRGWHHLRSSFLGRVHLVRPHTRRRRI